MNLKKLAFCCLITLMSRGCFSANILAVTTLASFSHHIWNKAYLLELVRKGHNVTILGHTEDDTKTMNFTMITMEGVSENLHRRFPLQDFVNYGPAQFIQFVLDWVTMTCIYDVKSNGLQTLLNYPQHYKFDLIVWDLNGIRCLYPLIDRFGAPPVIGTSPHGYPPQLQYMFGSITSSHIPFQYITNPDGSSYTLRLKTFLLNYMDILTKYYFGNPSELEIAKQIFGDNVRPIEEIEKNISLMLSNIDPVLGFPEPLPPNVIPVGGLHVSPPKKLPKNLQKLLDDARNGVIVVSFGTNLNWVTFGEKQREAIVEALQRLKQVVLFKSKEVDFELPKNVILKKWLPQSDILAHSNVKLLVNHGGALSTQEAIIRGIPIIGIPFFLDQHGNMARVQARQLGKSINYLNLTADTLHNSILEVLNNPVFRNNAQKLSELYKNQPQTAMEKAIFWTEYILKFGSAECLNLPTRKLNIFQRFDFDIIVLISVVLIVLIIICYSIFKLVKRLLKSITVSKEKLE